MPTATTTFCLKTRCVVLSSLIYCRDCGRGFTSDAGLRIHEGFKHRERRAVERHGTRGSYTNGRCRCDRCTQASTEYAVAYYARRKAARAAESAG